MREKAHKRTGVPNLKSMVHLLAHDDKNKDVDDSDLSKATNINIELSKKLEEFTGVPFSKKMDLS